MPEGDEEEVAGAHRVEVEAGERCVVSAREVKEGVIKVLECLSI